MVVSLKPYRNHAVFVLKNNVSTHTTERLSFVVIFTHFEFDNEQTWMHIRTRLSWSV